VQPSDIRVISDAAYREAGALIAEDLAPCRVVFAVKEIPVGFFDPGHTYVFFAHVVKGQPYNMPMLQALLHNDCQLIDYEEVTDEHGRRLIFFGHHAGLAGMIDTLWALGQRLDWEGISNPFSDLRQTYHYDNLDEAKAAVSALGARIAQEGLPEPITPFICGFAGYGNVFSGANEIIQLLPVAEISPEVVAEVAQDSADDDRIYEVVFKEEDIVEPISPQARFELQDYYDHPDKYRSKFNTYLPHLNVLVNCIYWEQKYPRLVTKRTLRQLYRSQNQPRLRVIGDISCDMEGAVEATVRCTEPDDPIYVYDPFEDQATPGVAGTGPVILAVDILPSELPREASAYFSSILTEYVPAIAEADYSLPFHQLDLPSEIKRALIVHQGRLTPDYEYLEKHLP
jgi:alpha-aminoadipic semialdehyde synthase